MGGGPFVGEGARASARVPSACLALASLNVDAVSRFFWRSSQGPIGAVDRLRCAPGTTRPTALADGPTRAPDRPVGAARDDRGGSLEPRAELADRDPGDGRRRDGAVVVARGDRRRRDAPGGASRRAARGRDRGGGVRGRPDPSGGGAGPPRGRDRPPPVVGAAAPPVRRPGRRLPARVRRARLPGLVSTRSRGGQRDPPRAHGAAQPGGRAHRAPGRAAGGARVSARRRLGRGDPAGLPR